MLHSWCGSLVEGTDSLGSTLQFRPSEGRKSRLNRRMELLPVMFTVSVSFFALNSGPDGKPVDHENSSYRKFGLSNWEERQETSFLVPAGRRKPRVGYGDARALRRARGRIPRYATHRRPLCRDSFCSPPKSRPKLHASRQRTRGRGRRKRAGAP